jgi:hypothetical protein
MPFLSGQLQKTTDSHMEVKDSQKYVLQYGTMNEKPQPKPLPEPNPVTYSAHRRDVLWQITVPIIIGTAVLLLAVIGVILAGSSGTGDISRWADISMIWLLTPNIILAVFVLVILCAFVYVFIYLLRVLPSYTRMAQDFFFRVQTQVRIYSDKAVEPILKIQSFKAGAKAIHKKS